MTPVSLTRLSLTRLAPFPARGGRPAAFSEMLFHDREGSGTAGGTKAFAIMNLLFLAL
jgi:hypothetical protein